MTEATIPRVVQAYLAQLDTALVGVADATAHDIRAAIAEEFAGLDAPTAAARIEQLGDPFFIAAEARDASQNPDTDTDRSSLPQTSATPTHGDGVGVGYILLASLLVALGGLVIPVLGWVVGIVLVLVSTAWTRVEKWIAILLPIATLLLAAMIAIVIAVSTTPAPAQTALSSSEFHAPTSEALNPLIPTWYDFVWASVLALVLVNFVVGITLMVCALRRRRTS
jgi:hypothetical protein